MKMILPCAGLGTRVGMKPHEAKELLTVEGEKYPIIDWSLDLAAKTHCEPIVISRKEKKEFNKYLRNKGIKPLIIKPEGEWMDTVLASSSSWGKNNVLVLPDTRFNNQYKIIDDVKFSLQQMKCPLALGMHYVTDPTKWCVKSGNWLIEKPKVATSNWAFGVIGFKKESGIRLFKELSENRESYLYLEVQYIEMQNFQDVTRGEFKLTK